MNAANFFESILSERNKSGQGVQRDLLVSEIPADILAIVSQQPKKKDK